jgi:hypothetical protein
MGECRALTKDILFGMSRRPAAVSANTERSAPNANSPTDPASERDASHPQPWATGSIGSVAPMSAGPGLAVIGAASTDVAAKAMEARKHSQQNAHFRPRDNASANLLACR